MNQILKVNTRFENKNYVKSENKSECFNKGEKERGNKNVNVNIKLKTSI